MKLMTHILINLPSKSTTSKLVLQINFKEQKSHQ